MREQLGKAYRAPLGRQMSGRHRKISEKSISNASVCQMEPLEDRQFLSTYYVSPSGSDSASGTSTSAPWKTITRVNNQKLKGGDQVLFKGGTSFSGSLYAVWYASNGAQGKAPTDPELLKAYDMLRKGSGLETAERNKLGQELKKVIVDQQWVIGTVGFTPTLRVVGNRIANVPDRYSGLTRTRTPGAVHPSTYYFKS